MEKAALEFFLSGNAGYGWQAELANGTDQRPRLNRFVAALQAGDRDLPAGFVL